MLPRRRLLGAAAAVPATSAFWLAAARAQAPDVQRLLRKGGVAVMLRHATTTPGVGDPPGFQPGVCITQRNLSDAGRAEARRIGAWFSRHKLAPAAVRSSAWCRCIDTAELAFGSHLPWPAIDSTFSSGDAAQRLPQLRDGLRALKSGRFEVWVTHQINITAATGASLAMGHAVLVRAASGGELPAEVLARLSFEP